jgi:hypothetical protein
MSDEMTTEEYLAIRKKAALEIDPRTGTRRRLAPGVSVGAKK